MINYVIVLFNFFQLDAHLSKDSFFVFTSVDVCTNTVN